MSAHEINDELKQNQPIKLNDIKFATDFSLNISIINDHAIVHLKGAPDYLTGSTDMADLDVRVRGIVHVLAHAVEFLKVQIRKQNYSLQLKINEKLILTENRD